MACSLFFFLFFFSPLLFLSFITPSLSKSTPTTTGDDDEDLSFLEEVEVDAVPHHTPLSDPLEDFGSFHDLEPPSEYGHESDDEEFSNSHINEKEGNFSDFIKSNKYVIVEFYALWCGHCQALAPKYVEAATELKEKAVVLAKVDAIEESELVEEYEMQGFPTVYFVVDGGHSSSSM